MLGKVRCVCLDDSGRPDEIPAEKWPRKKEMYNIVHVYYHPMQGVQGVELDELKLDVTNYPYETYKINRFAILEDDLDKLVEMIKQCNDLNHIDLGELSKEVTLT